MSRLDDLGFACPIDDEAVRAFQTHGAVCIRNAFSPEQISLLTRGIESNLASPSPRAKVASSASDPGWFFEDFCNWQENADYRDFIFNSALAPIAAALLGMLADATSISTIFKLCAWFPLLGMLAFWLPRIPRPQT